MIEDSNNGELVQLERLKELIFFFFFFFQINFY
jgi:hypothetical protein